MDDLATNLTTTTTNDQPGVSGRMAGENVDVFEVVVDGGTDPTVAVAAKHETFQSKEGPVREYQNGSPCDLFRYKNDGSIVSFCANAGLRATEMFR